MLPMRRQCPALLPLRLLFQLVNNIHKVLLPALPSSCACPQRSTHAKVAKAAIDGAAYSVASSLLAILFSVFSLVVSANFYRDFDLTWSDGRGKVLNNGQLLTLSLDKASGSDFQSKNEYLFGKIDMQIKLIPDNSAGTVTAYYVSLRFCNLCSRDSSFRVPRFFYLGDVGIHILPILASDSAHLGSLQQLLSQGPTHDKIDFEFLGNLPLHTAHQRVLAGEGQLGAAIQALVRPKTSTPTPSSGTPNTSYVLTSSLSGSSFSVDGIPIRDFRNNEARGVPFPKNQPMRIYSSLWNADDCASWGGLVKTDWSKAPFVAAYRNFNADACVASRGTSSNCASYKSPASGSRSSAWWNPGAGHHQPEVVEVGAKGPHDLQLLRRREALPAGASS
ncbi:hypothetical protein Taro_024378 [Colocasia esculenta]|uniref:GH16 domain-containing protein n=1 Tax=Colocasia esculenta TaxID=4460 RepID=A0A843VK62_COLES|nr:hypothetical protein [Colocasia esculenta]